MRSTPSLPRLARPGLALGVVLALIVSLTVVVAAPQAARAVAGTPNATMRMEVGSESPLLLTQLNIGNDLGQTEGFKRNWNSGWSIAQLWASVPDDIKHNIGFVLHQGHTALSDRNPAMSAKWMEDNIAEADALGIPIFILWDEGRTIASNSTRFQFLESLYQKYPHFMGTVVSEQADTLGDLPEALRIANLYGGFHILGSLEETNALATRLETQSYWNSVAQYKQNFIFNPKNFHENFETVNAWTQGAWLSGVFDNWGPYFDGYPYYSCGFFGARSSYTGCGDRWSRSIAETVTSMMMLDQWQNGATVFQMENQLDMPTTGNLYSPYFYQSILPAMRHILSHDTPTREDVIAKTKIVYSEATSPVFALADSLAGRTGNPKMTTFFSMYEKSAQLTAVQKGMWFYLRGSGRYNIIPRIPKLAPATLLSRFETVLTKETYDPSLMYGDARAALFDAKYPQISTGEAFVQRAGKNWLMYNTNDRDNFNEDAVIDLTSSTFTRLEMAEVTPHTWAAITEEGSRIDLTLDTYRTDREADLLKPTGTRDMEFNRNFVKYAYVPNPQDSALRTTTMRFDVASKPVLTISGYDRNSYAYAEEWNPNTGQYTLTVQSNGVVNISLDTDGGQDGWTVVAPSSAQVTTAPGATEVVFDGTSVAWNAPAGASGSASVSIDGTSYGTVQIVAGETFRATGLPNGMHTLRIEGGGVPAEFFAYVPSVEHDASQQETNDFNYGSAADDEDVLYGSDSWRIIDGKLKLVGFVFPFYGDTTVYNTNAKLANVRYDAKLKLIRGTSGALVIRGNEDTKQAYHFRLDPSRTAEGRTGSATYSCSLMLDYGTTALATCPTSLTLNPEQEYAVSVVANGNTITASIDGTHVLSFTASGSNVRGAGYTGVRAPQMQSDSGYRLGQFVQLDDVSVTDLDSGQVVYSSDFAAWEDAEGWMTETPLVFDWNEKPDPRSSFTFPWQWQTSAGTWGVVETSAFTSGFSGYYRAESTGAQDMLALGGADSAWADDGDYDYWSWVNAAEGGAAGIAVRAQDADTMYQARLDVASDMVIFGSLIDGDWTPLASALAPSAVENGQWHLIKVTARGPLFSVMVDGHKVLETVDDTLTAGAVGIWTPTGGVVEVDDARVVARPGLSVSSPRAAATIVPADGIAGRHITGYEHVAIKTARTKQPALPATVIARYSDGTAGQVAVTWPAITEAQLATATTPRADGPSRGKFTIEGTVAGTDRRVSALVTVMPNITTSLNVTSTYDPRTPTVPAMKYDIATLNDGTNTYTKILYVRWDATPRTAAGAPRTQTITGTINAYPWEKATATVTVLTAPGTPTAVTATPGDTRAAVRWIAPADDGGAAISGYTVTATPNGATCTTTGAINCSVDGLTNDTAYTFTVVATNSSGSSLASPASAPVTPNQGADGPAAASDVVATARDGAAQISWRAPEAPASPITGYTVTADPGGAGCTATGTTCAVDGLTNGTSYVFRVVAATASAHSGASDPSNAVTPSATATVPGSPRTPAAVPGSAQVRVSWTAPASDGGSTVLDYSVRFATGGIACVTAATSCVVTGLVNGTAQTFTVTARNASGYSPATVATTAVTPVAGNVAVNKAVTAYAQLANTNRVPAKMVDGNLTLGWYSGGATDYAFSSGATTLTQGSLCTWAYVDLGADYAVGSFRIQFGENLTTNGNMFDPPYQIQVLTSAEAAARTAAERNSSVCTRLQGGNFGSIATGSTGPGTPFVVAPANDIWRTVTSGTGTAALATKALATPETARYVRVFSTEPNTAHRFGLAVFELEVLTADQPAVPASPTGVTAVPVDGAATVSWVAPARDGGSAVSGYTVTALPGGATCTPTTTSCTVTGLTNGQEYRFTVTATNAAGTSLPSGASMPAVPRSVPLSAVSAPQIAGIPAVGRTLTASGGQWNVPGAALSYQWTRDGAPIGGATTPTYLVGPSDVDSAIRVVVSARLTGHADGESVSESLTGRTVQTAATLSLSSAAQTATGDPAVVTATVRTEFDEPAAGTVTILDGEAVLIGDAELDATGSVSVTLSDGMTVGTHAIRAEFAPSAPGAVAPASTESVAYDVVRATSSTVVTVSASGQYFGTTSPAVATATVEVSDGSAPAGTVRLWDGDDEIGSGELTASGIVKITLPADLGGGEHTLTAEFLPAAEVESSRSAALTFTVATASSTTTLELSAQAQDYEATNPATATVRVSSNDTPQPRGTIRIVDAGEPVTDAVELAADGVAHIPLPADLAVGNHYLNAVFTPADERSIAPSTSTPSLLFLVRPDASATTLTSDRTSQVYGGTPTTVTIAVSRGSGAAADGQVAVRDGSAEIAVAPLAAGSAVITLPADLAIGTHSLTAVYTPADSANVNGSTSSAVTLTVARAATQTTATLSVTSQEFGTASPATIEVAVTAETGAAGSGTVSLRDGDTAVVSMLPLAADGTAAITIPSNLSVGAHSLSVWFAATPASGQATSSSTQVAFTVAPYPTPSPTITGASKVGSELTAVPGAWAPLVEFSYQWKHDGGLIAGATDATYTPVASDLDKTITVVVTGSKTGHAPISRESNATPPVEAGTFATTEVPQISGTAKIGSTLTSVPGSWAPTAEFSYQWERGGVAIEGARYATYLLTAADLGETITVVVTGMKSGYVSASKESQPTDAVAPAQPWELRGFNPPVDMGGVWNTVKGGSTVPFKFELFEGSTELTSTSAVKSFTAVTVACPGASAATDEIELLATGGTGLAYVDGQFLQKWQTPKSPGACVKVTVTAKDNSKLVANFKLR